jgi:predicted small metal-binding protein
VCDHVIEAVEEEELRRLVREHALEVHGQEIDDERLTAATREG